MQDFQTTLKVVLALLILSLPVTLPAYGSSDEAGYSIRDALKQGKTRVNLRYRYEAVDDDAFGDTAEASTLRTSLSYLTADWKGWSLFLEAEDVSALFDDDGYNNAGAGSLNNGVRGVPVVADPKLTEMNQAWLRYRNAHFTAILGRQEINLGDQRFVGAVAWRQNHQSFDAARLQLKASPKFQIDYSYITRVHRIFGDSIDLEGHLLLAPITLAEDQRLTAYGFLLDYDFAVINSTSTYGLEYAGKFALSDGFTLKLELEAAQQTDAGDNSLNIDTTYSMASLGGEAGRYGFDLAWEVLGGRDGGMRAFQTPLATLHKWNGWADKFLQTPNPGLETLYLRFKGKLNNQWRFMVVYHEFTSDEGNFDYGTEVDAELVYTSPWKQTFALKFADYSADDFSSDTQKLMLWSSYTF